MALAVMKGTLALFVLVGSTIYVVAVTLYYWQAAGGQQRRFIAALCV